MGPESQVCSACNAPLPAPVHPSPPRPGPLDLTEALNQVGTPGQTRRVDIHSVETALEVLLSDGSGSGETAPGVPIPIQSLHEVPLTDRYDVLDAIGRGASAVVYRAHDRKLGRNVAVKRLLPDLQSTPEFARMLDLFARESRTIAALNHRNIAQIYDLDRDHEGPYIVMEYVDGGSLAQFLATQGKMPAPDAVRLIRDVARGLAYAHRLGLVHRDVKPGNILLATDETGQPSPKLVDFGLARLPDVTDEAERGRAVGTPLYMAPEQYRDAAGVDGRADIYSLGKVLYHLVTGDVPNVFSPEKVPPPAALAEIIVKCTAHGPDDRYPDANELARALDALSQTEEPAAIKEGPHGGKRCSGCGTENDSEARYCAGCGQGFFFGCPECGRDTPTGAEFCPNCGTEVNGFLLMQCAWQRMQLLAVNRRWAEVVAEGARVPPNLRLPGAIAGHILQDLRAIQDEASRFSAKEEHLRQEVQRAVAADRAEEALRLLAQYQTVNPNNTTLNALQPQLRQRVDDVDFHAAEQEAAGFVAQEAYGDAIAAFQEYLTKHPRGQYVEFAGKAVQEELAEAQRMHDILQTHAYFKDLVKRQEAEEARKYGQELVRQVRAMKKPAQITKLPRFKNAPIPTLSAEDVRADVQMKLQALAARARTRFLLYGTAAILLVLGLGLTLVCVSRASQATRQGETPMLVARKAAVDAGAQKDATALWTAAENVEAEARADFRRGRFTAAASRWQAATTAYNDARQLAEGVGQARKTQTSYDELLSSVNIEALRELADIHLSTAQSLAAEATADLADGKWQDAERKWLDASRSLDAARDATAKKQEEESFRAAVQAGNLEQALQIAPRCRERYAPAATFLATHQRAQQSRTTAAEKQRHGVLTGADKGAGELWARGCRLSETAEKEFWACRVDKAEALWNEAAALFSEAQGVASSAVAGRGAKADYEAAVARAKPELLTQHAATEWEDARRAADEGQRLEDQQDWIGFEKKWKQASKSLGEATRKTYEALMARANEQLLARGWAAAATAFREAKSLPGYEDDRPAQLGLVQASLEELLVQGEDALTRQDWKKAVDASEKALELDPTSERAKRLQEQAGQSGKPRLRIVAMADGREVTGATVLLDDRTMPQTTPAVIDLVEGKTYSIRVTMPLFHGAFETTYKAVPGTQVIQATLSALPPDLLAVSSASYPPVEALAPGSREAQERQRKEVEKAKLPLEVRTAKSGIVLRLVPAGTFQMGSPATEKDRDAGDGTPERATVPRTIYVGKLEVTIAQWETVTGQRLAPPAGGNRDCPAVMVSWEECQAFCGNLCKLEGVPPHTYRLLLETEWEYACRAGTQAARYWGDGTDEATTKSYCWYAKNACSRFWTSPHAPNEGPQTDPRRPNAFGLHNMLGNVWEWCQDRTSATGAGKMQPFRGGSWTDDLNECRSARRQSNSRTCTWDRLGFRIVRVMR
ncbi:MAG: hypothetical protein A3K19_28710 [Lentisphaerae bacterium RIFOXYB12_FULL_65_16]|nr:MAG: hypothetical protein A3K19_28710 [Lentisphaerae bacterium RIFOXYB12_FULL_65_16]